MDHEGVKKSPPKLLKKEEFADKKHLGHSWIILHGKVYDVGHFMAYHPGGGALIEPFIGCDATDAFVRAHKWVDADKLLEGYYVGFLEE